MLTLEQAIDQPIHNFNDEKIMGIFSGEGSVIIYTNAAAYILDKGLQIQDRKPLPSSIPMQEAVELTFNRDISKVAYSLEDGIYLCDMAENAQPVLLQKHPQKDSIVEQEYLYPVRFLDSDRLFVGVGMWECSAGYYLILDFDGNTREKVPFFVSGEHSGGYIFHNQAEVIHFYEGGSYYNFANEKLEPASWLAIQYGGLARCIADPSNPHIWYFSLPQGKWNNTEKTIFVLADTQKRTLTDLPFSVIGANATLLSADDDGNLLFMYAYKGEHSFGVYQAVAD